MYANDKHIHSYKIARYAANIIQALKHAYNIKDKRDLFADKNGENKVMIITYQIGVITGTLC